MTRRDCRFSTVVKLTTWSSGGVDVGERPVDDGTCRLGGEAVTPLLAGEAPADLDARREPRLPGRRRAASPCRPSRRCRGARPPSRRSRARPTSGPAGRPSRRTARAVSVDGKCRITSGSALSAAYAGLSSSRHGRTSSRAVCRCGASLIAYAAIDGERLAGRGGVDALDHLDAGRTVEHERQRVDGLLVPAHQRDQLVGIEAGRERRVQLVGAGDDVVVLLDGVVVDAAHQPGRGARRRSGRWPRPRRARASGRWRSPARGPACGRS